MKSLNDFSKIYIHKAPIDMRKQINGLSVIIAEEMKLDLKSSSLFVFTNRRRILLKILYFDKSGFALWTKKLEESKFSWPKKIDEKYIIVSLDDMELLLEGINIWTRFEKVDFTHVV